MTDPASPRNQSASLRRAMKILDQVRDASDGHGCSLTDLADALGLDKSTILRLAAPLQESHLLARDADTGRFRLGLGALRLGQAYLSGLDLRDAASGPLRLLQREAQGTAHLVLYEEGSVVYIDKVEDADSVRMASRIGSRMPAYRTAVGRTILAWSEEAEVARCLDAELPAATEFTLTDPAALRAELAVVRGQGFAVDDRQNEIDVRCVAAPVFDAADRVAGALSVSGLTSRMSPERALELAPRVVAAADEVSRVLGATRGAVPAG